MAKKTPTNAPASTPASSAPEADQPAAESTTASAGDQPTDEPAGSPQDAPTAPQDSEKDTAPADATGTEDAEGGQEDPAKAAALDAALEAARPRDVAEVEYYRTDRYSRWVQSGTIYQLVANTLITSLTHDVEEMRRQGVPLVRVPDETTELDTRGDQLAHAQPAHRHHGVV